MPSTCARVSGSSRSSHPLKWPSAGAGWLKKPRAGEPYLRTKSSAGRQGLVAKIVAPALPSTSRSAEATCGLVGDQGAPAGASACINSQARTVPLGARVTATWNGFCFVRQHQIGLGAHRFDVALLGCIGWSFNARLQHRWEQTRNYPGIRGSEPRQTQND